MQYKDLYALLRGEPEARRYFDSLPSYAREQIQTRPDGVNSLASLKDYADNLLRGESKGAPWDGKKGQAAPGPPRPGGPEPKPHRQSPELHREGRQEQVHPQSDLRIPEAAPRRLPT